MMRIRNPNTCLVVVLDYLKDSVDVGIYLQSQ